MAADILAAIEKQIPGFSKGQKRIANYITTSYDKAAFMTASKLGSKVGVSESTVVRFAVELGFDGYPSMQKALQDMVRSKLTSVQRNTSTDDRFDDQDLVSMVLHSDMESLRLTNEALDRRTLDQTVDLILGARDLYIIGVRSSAAIAVLMEYYFRNLLDHVHLLAPTATDEMLEQLHRVGPQDVVIGISLPRDSGTMAKPLQFARDRGAEVIVLTESHDAPAARYAAHVLVARSDTVFEVDSLVAPMSVVNALIVAIDKKKGQELSRVFADLEHIWNEYEVYERIEP